MVCILLQLLWTASEVSTLDQSGGQTGRRAWHAGAANAPATQMASTAAAQQQGQKPGSDGGEDLAALRQAIALLKGIEDTPTGEVNKALVAKEAELQRLLDERRAVQPIHQQAKGITEKIQRLEERSEKFRVEVMPELEDKLAEARSQQAALEAEKEALALKRAKLLELAPVDGHADGAARVTAQLRDFMGRMETFLQAGAPQLVEGFRLFAQDWAATELAAGHTGGAVPGAATGAATGGALKVFKRYMR